ncbi:MAG: biopolymer transporter ExbD [Gemmatimonadetes bacterium]|jgi:biopolymer transport protein ExbD|nr:biopolymer transporter ExbD [Gemmatimonadota bacterium]MBT5060436.1 biopolymer transporter ExbD [Gemmatimonadota bacterium]MBT5142418.1 biopolymer transporter ExbD [Gemmatimonadota bacterium]MBT5588204.1 biopolymer transporter ExbD [Gemmatimonadota bacterium]MBT5961055.1 biopolymer transporter ExbD [Gemmatimonadota bacterium]
MPKHRPLLEDEELNMTPMIDCVFLLLIFFMVTTVFKEPYSLRVELPEAQQAQIVEEKKLVASIAADGTMEINRQPVTLANLDEVLRRAKASTRSLTLVVRTDKETKHQHVLDLFEAAKRAGIEQIPLATDDPADD